MDDVRLVMMGADQPTIAGARNSLTRNGLDRARAIASCDVLLQARRRDEFVPAVRQALASGVPVVGFDSGGTATVVEHERNGLLVRFDRRAGEPGLRRSVRRFMDEPEMRSSLAQAARASVEGRTWRRAAAEINAHLEAIVPGAIAV